MPVGMAGMGRYMLQTAFPALAEDNGASALADWHAFAGQWSGDSAPSADDERRQAWADLSEEQYERLLPGAVLAHLNGEDVEWALAQPPHEVNSMLRGMVHAALMAGALAAMAARAPEPGSACCCSAGIGPVIEAWAPRDPGEALAGLSQVTALGKPTLDSVLPSAQADDLQARIRAAFAKVPEPTSAELFQTRIDEDDSEMESLRARWHCELRGRHPELPALLRGHDFYARRLPPDIWRYLLRDVLLDCVDGQDRYDYLEPLAYHIAAAGRDEAFARNVASLSADQQVAACEVLGWRLRSQLGDQDPLTEREAFRECRWELCGMVDAIRLGWGEVDHWAVDLANQVRRRWTEHTWPDSADAEVAALQAQIRAAFEDTPYPPDGVICSLTYYDLEPAEIAVALAGADWRTVHPELLASQDSALSFLDPDAFRFFLPAWLMADLLDVGWNTDPVFHLTFALAGLSAEEAVDPSAVGMAEHSRRKVSALARDEREVVVAYLRYQAERYEFSRDDIAAALEQYWLPSLAE